MEHPLKISIITTFFNQRAWVRTCLDSLLAQQGDFELEILAVDDSSTDGTADILREYSDPRLRLILFESNRGVSAARNTALEQMTGDCFFFMDGDDYLPEGALAALAARYTPDVDWVQGDYSLRAEDGSELSLSRYRAADYGSHEDIAAHFRDLEFAYIHNKLMNARLRDVRFPIGKQLLEDLAWNFAAFPHLRRIVVSGCITYCYVIHPRTLSRTEDKKRHHIEYWLEVLAQMRACPEPCWHDYADFCQLEWVERRLYRYHGFSAWQSSMRQRLRQECRLGERAARFSFRRRIFHKLIVSRAPNYFVYLFCKSYYKAKALRQALRHRQG